MDSAARELVRAMEEVARAMEEVKEDTREEVRPGVKEEVREERKEEARVRGLVALCAEGRITSQTVHKGRDQREASGRSAL